jgi:outer membrane receptor protein involved in Fe transport
VVVDEITYQPIDSATISLVGTDIASTTGRWGAFSFPDAPLGTVQLHVSAPGHPSVVQQVEVGRDGVVFVQIVLPSVAAVLSGLVVPGVQHRGGAAEAARTAADLLAIQVPRTRVSSGDIAKNDYQVRLRDAVTLMGSSEPMILIDGAVMSRDAAYDALMSIPASDVQDIQVLKGPAAASLYPYAANGVIHVRTKRGS